MKQNIIRLCMKGLLCTFALHNNLLCTTKQDDESTINMREIEKEQKEYSDQNVMELIKSQQIPGDKRSFSIRRGDGKLSLGARAAQEYYFYKNPMMLNSALPDEYGFFKTTADIFLQSYWGKKKFGHKALEAYFCIRHKSEWGLFGKSTSADKATVTVGQVESKPHTHSASKPLLWLKDAWVKMSLGAALQQNWTTEHYLKIGFFPFQLGRGISLGQGYGTGKEFLGIYNRINDFCAPGILMTGTLLKDVLEYDLYYAKYEEKGQSSGQTFASTRENHVGKRTIPYRGVAKDDELWALQVRWTATNSKQYGTVDVTPYIFYNEASDRTVEFESDSKSRLGTGGVQLEYKHPRFEIGGECAFNFGYEELYNIDRNRVRPAQFIDFYQIVNDAHGKPIKLPHLTLHNKTNGEDAGLDSLVKEVYTHVEFTPNKSVPKTTTQGPAYFPAPATAAHKSVLLRNEDKGNGESFTEGIAEPNNLFYADAEWTNKSNRYRPNYRNQYRGWMVVGDMSYIIPEVGCTLSLGAGSASGDQNPHKDEVNKNYKGFIGLHELYTGHRINSIFFLDQRTIKRPLTMSDSSKDAETEDESFTDLTYLGIGATWSPKLKSHKWSLNTNSVFFFKQFPSKKYDSENGTLSDSDASQYLGYELNFITEFTIFTDLKLSAKLAAFMPGTYYSDIKGVPLKGDIFEKLEEADKARLDSANYRLSNDTAYFVNFKLDYRF